MTEPKETPRLLPWAADGHVAVLELYAEAKKREAEARAEAEELRSHILHLTWGDEVLAALRANGMAGLALTVAGVPAVTVRYTEPKRFQTAQFKKDHPHLATEYTKTGAPEVRVELPK